ncbi:MAG: tyrosine--tRNA ligase [Candidatus Levyibacteriota bacterium]|jgi:tyrosyl-tRNA synthetase
MTDIDELLTRGVANIIPGIDELKRLLKSSQKLNIYFGIDPTATHIHLGHAVPLRKLQQLADLGHNVTFLIGDFTALIGDTSDKDSERPVLTKEQIEQNFQTYKKQAEKILDFSKVNIRYNSEWLSKINLEEFIKLSHHFSFGDIAGRELIAKRLKDGRHVGLHEALYPVLQGYDSYFLDTDIQIGGTDQTFNMQAGRILQKDLRSKQSFVLANPFLEGTDGRKMSKTWGNAIWLDDAPNDMYVKAMAINDNLIVEYFTLATGLSIENIKKIESELKKGENPINIKKKLAHQIVKELYDEKSADEAQENFQRTVQNKELPNDIKVYSNSDETNILQIMYLSGLTNSISEGKRLMQQKGVYVDNALVESPDYEFDITSEHIIKVGKQIRKIKKA